jgi:hypothetical protein
VGGKRFDRLLVRMGFAHRNFITKARKDENTKKDIREGGKTRRNPGASIAGVFRVSWFRYFVVS